MASKFVPEPEEADQLILDTIRKIQKSKKRAYSELVFKKLPKQYRLDESPFMLQLTSMMATGKVENIPTKESLESLRIDNAEVNLHVESQDQNGKGRKPSSDEDKVIERRNQLQAVAEAEQEKLVSCKKGKLCDSDKESNGDSDSDMESDRDTESIQSGSDSEGEIKCLQDGLVSGQNFGSENGEILRNENGVNTKRDIQKKISISILFLH